jgi:hypothetical protein
MELITGSDLNGKIQIPMISHIKDNRHDTTNDWLLSFV